VSFDFDNAEPLLTTLARLFAHVGLAREVAVLANAESCLEESSYENWNGGTYGYGLQLTVPHTLYADLEGHLKIIESNILVKTQELLRAIPNRRVDSVTVLPMLATDPQWREKAKAWVSGIGVNNQGRVRSDNLAAKSCDGLLFRSQPEIFLYKALKTEGVSFAPLPVFVRGGKQYKRIEPDFVILTSGVVLIVEVDGDTVHHETPVDAHARTTMLIHEGAHLERVKASECENAELAKECAQKLLALAKKLKQAK